MLWIAVAWAAPEEAPIAAPADPTPAPAGPAPVSPVAAPPADPAAPPADASTGDDEPALTPVEAVHGAVRRVPERWTIPEATLDAVRASALAPIGRRMEAATRGWLGLPYLNEAAGEMDADDPDPPARYDSFDCLTFVEEVLGITLAADPLYAPGIRDALRYKGAEGDLARRAASGWTRRYDQRRHFMEAEWLPDAVRNGFLTDITARIGPARLLEHTVDAGTWQRWGHTRFFHLPPALYPVGTWRLDYLDLPTAAATAARIPAGAVVVTVRQARAWSPIAITHVSLVVEGADGRRHMRHASRMGARKVRDDDLNWYVRHLNDYVNWPSLGIAVYMPREQGPRVSALTPVPLPAPNG